MPVSRTDLHRVLVAPRGSELSYILNDCAARVFITSKHKADQAMEIVDDTPGVELRLMLDGVVPGHASSRTPSPGAPMIRCRSGRGYRHALLVGDDRSAEGCDAGVAHEPLATATNPVAGLMALL